MNACVCTIPNIFEIGFGSRDQLLLLVVCHALVFYTGFSEAFFEFINILEWVVGLSSHYQTQSDAACCDSHIVGVVKYGDEQRTHSPICDKPIKERRVVVGGWRGWGGWGIQPPIGAVCGHGRR